MAKDNTIYYLGGAAALAFILFGSKKANAGGVVPIPTPSPDPQQPDFPIETPKEDDIIILDDEIPVPPQATSAWGVTPEKYKLPFAKLEAYTQIPGLARYFAIRAWGAFRAMKPIVSYDEALKIAQANPDLAMKFHNTSASERKASCAGIERVTLPKGELGKCGGTGSQKDPWPKPLYIDQWKDFGSAGQFDMLASSFVYAGIHSGYVPFINLKPEIMFDPKAQMYAFAIMVYRIIKGPYKVLTNNPKDTWTNIAKVVANPSAFQNNTQYSKDVGLRFQARAGELGIDISNPDIMGNPTVDVIAKWPGDKKLFEFITSEIELK